jgi:hypothetical protein
VVGYALLCIQDVESKTIWVMDEREFLTIDHLFNPNRTIRVEGLMPWLDSMRLRYGLRTVLWHQDETIHDRWMAAIEESKLREAPRPEFLQVPWGEDAQGEMTVREWLGRRQLLLDEESRTYRALVAQTPGGPYPPEFWALMVAVAGYAVYPWQKPEDELAMRRGPFPRNPLFQLVARHARNS